LNSFLSLRLFVPCLLQPDVYLQTSKDTLSPPVTTLLGSLAKLLQKSSNNSLFDESNVLSPLNPVLKNFSDKMREFLDLVSIGEGPENPLLKRTSFAEHSNLTRNQLNFAKLCHYLFKNMKSLQKFVWLYEGPETTQNDIKLALEYLNTQKTYVEEIIGPSPARPGTP